MTIEEFKIKFKEIKEKGFIKSTRRGPYRYRSYFGNLFRIKRK